MEIGLFFSAFSLVTVLLRPLVGWVVDRFGRNAQASSRDSIAGTFLGFVLLNAPILMGGQVAQLDSRTVLFIAYGAIALFALFRTLPLLPETRPALGEEAPTPIR